MRKFAIAAGFALALSSAPSFADNHPQDHGLPPHWQNVLDIAATLKADLEGTDYAEQSIDLMNALDMAVETEQSNRMHEDVHEMRNHAARISEDRENTQQEVQRVNDHIDQMRSDLERMEQDRNEMERHITQMGEEETRINADADALEAEANAIESDGQ